MSAGGQAHAQDTAGLTVQMQQQQHSRADTCNSGYAAMPAEVSCTGQSWADSARATAPAQQSRHLRKQVCLQR